MPPLGPYPDDVPPAHCSAQETIPWCRIITKAEHWSNITDDGQVYCRYVRRSGRRLARNDPEFRTRRMYSTNVLNRIDQGFRAAFRGFEVTVFRTPWLIDPLPSAPPRIALPTAAYRGPAPEPLNARLPNDILPLPPGDPDALHNLGRSPLILTAVIGSEGGNPLLQTILTKSTAGSNEGTVVTVESCEHFDVCLSFPLMPRSSSEKEQAFP